MATPTQGMFYSKEGIYEFDGHHYIARWYANATQMRIDEMKPILESGYDAGDTRWPKAVLVAGIVQWNKIRAAGFGSWTGLTKLHCYDSTVNAGMCPEWAAEFNSYDGFLIHEYAPGKVMFMRDIKDLYIFFKDSPPPAEVPIEEPTGEPTGEPETSGGTTGGIAIPASIDLNIHIFDHSKPTEW
ncbi:hypothetical protein MUP56_02470 [Patescibacteria group bacterium]|nr:hypothetical protein [Patescibacteria group bacterium]